MQKVKVCIQCNSEYVAIRKDQKYCSNACKCKYYWPKTKQKDRIWERLIFGMSSRNVCTLTPEDLQFLYMCQSGICAISGFKLTRVLGEGKGLNNKTLYNISVDRIDQTKGYILGNVRLVCYQANMMRSILSDYELITWCDAIKTNLSKEAARKKRAAKK